MVAKMKKFIFLAFHKDWDKFLLELRDLGMIHVVEHDSKDIEESSLLSLIDNKKQLDAARKTLEKSRGKKSDVPFNEPDVELGNSIPVEIEKIEAKKTSLEQQLMVTAKEKETLAPWGNFDPKQITQLESAGYNINFFSAPTRDYKEEWEEQYDILIVKREASRIFFITVSQEDNMPELLNLEEEKLPDASLNELNSLIKSIEEKLKKQEETLVKLSDDLLSVEAAITVLENEIQFSRVVQSGTPMADNKIILLQGWSPENNVHAVSEYLDEQSVYYEMFDPVPEDDVPIKFKNNKFARLFEPIAELYELPRYNEIDLTPYFAPFYMIFFGLALGDIGYGLFLLTVSTIIKLVKKKSISKTIRGTMTLVQILGASTMICGLLQGGFFGFSLYETDSPFFSNLGNWFSADNNQMFTLSLVLGAVQVMLGMFIRIFNRIKQFGITHALSSIGWFVFIISFIVAYLLPNVLTMTGTIHSAIMIASGVLIVFFNAPGKSVFVNLGSALWDAYNTVTGLLGDILSYLRLFALGLSGGILASVFSSLALGMSPDNAILGPIVTVLIFLFGHAINIFMNALGAFVHPLRLTFVEFYNNSDFTGGGKKYRPFAKY